MQTAGMVLAKRCQSQTFATHNISNKTLMKTHIIIPRTHACQLYWTWNWSCSLNCGVSELQIAQRPPMQFKPGPHKAPFEHGTLNRGAFFIFWHAPRSLQYSLSSHPYMGASCGSMTEMWWKGRRDAHDHQAGQSNTQVLEVHASHAPRQNPRVKIKNTKKLFEPIDWAMRTWYIQKRARKWSEICIVGQRALLHIPRKRRTVDAPITVPPWYTLTTSLVCAVAVVRKTNLTLSVIHWYWT